MAKVVMINYMEEKVMTDYMAQREQILFTEKVVMII